MIRVHVICEGQTEEMFVNELLRSPFAHRNIDLRPSKIGKPGHKGGDFRYVRLLSDLKTRLLQDDECFCTTFFDFYALPKSFPGCVEAQSLSNATCEAKAELLNAKLLERLKEDIGEKPVLRFIPYVQMYEFEGLLFSDPDGIAKGIGCPDIRESLRKIRDDFSSPEEINDSPYTAPSKRILNLFPRYEKPIYGSLSAIEMGLDVIRGECHLFNNWLLRLEQIS
jgi:hypothetical protein